MYFTDLSSFMKYKRLVLRDYRVERLFYAAIQTDIRDFMQIIPQGTYSL